MFGVMTGGRGHERQIQLRMRKGFQQWNPPEMEGSALESREHPVWGGGRGAAGGAVQAESGFVKTVEEWILCRGLD